MHTYVHTYIHKHIVHTLFFPPQRCFLEQLLFTKALHLADCNTQLSTDYNGN